MSRLYLLDTNIASYVMKDSIPAVSRRIAKVSMAQLAVSAVTEGELRYGVARRPDASRLQIIVDEFLRLVTILPWDSEAARNYGRIRAKLEREGQPMGNLDMMIGAHARALEAVLVRNNPAFRRMPKVKIKDWTSDAK